MANYYCKLAELVEKVDKSLSYFPIFKMDQALDRNNPISIIMWRVLDELE